jgi:hypothetical protein
MHFTMLDVLPRVPFVRRLALRFSSIASPSPAVEGINYFNTQAAYGKAVRSGRSSVIT